MNAEEAECIRWLAARPRQECTAERHDNPYDPEPDCTCTPPPDRSGE